MRRAGKPIEKKRVRRRVTWAPQLCEFFEFDIEWGAVPAAASSALTFGSDSRQVVPPKKSILHRPPSPAAKNKPRAASASSSAQPQPPRGVTDSNTLVTFEVGSPELPAASLATAGRTGSHGAGYRRLGSPLKRRAHSNSATVSQPIITSVTGRRRAAGPASSASSSPHAAASSSAPASSSSASATTSAPADTAASGTVAMDESGESPPSPTPTGSPADGGSPMASSPTVASSPGFSPLSSGSLLARYLQSVTTLSGGGSPRSGAAPSSDAPTPADAGVASARQAASISELAERTRSLAISLESAAPNSVAPSGVASGAVSSAGPSQPTPADSPRREMSPSSSVSSVSSTGSMDVQSTAAQSPRAQQAPQPSSVASSFRLEALSPKSKLSPKSPRRRQDAPLSDSASTPSVAQTPLSLSSMSVSEQAAPLPKLSDSRGDQLAAELLLGSASPRALAGSSPRSTSASFFSSSNAASSGGLPPSSPLSRQNSLAMLGNGSRFEQSPRTAADLRSTAASDPLARSSEPKSADLRSSLVDVRSSADFRDRERDGLESSGKAYFETIDLIAVPSTRAQQPRTLAPIRLPSRAWIIDAQLPTV